MKAIEHLKTLAESARGRQRGFGEDATRFASKAAEAAKEAEDFEAAVAKLEKADAS